MVAFYALDLYLCLVPLFVCKFTPSIKWKLACWPQLPSLPLKAQTNICTHINFHSFAALLYQRYHTFFEIFTPAFENIMATERWQVFVLFCLFTYPIHLKLCGSGLMFLSCPSVLLIWLKKKKILLKKIFGSKCPLINYGLNAGGQGPLNI